MPTQTPNAKRLTTNAKILFRVSGFLLLALLLSGCAAVGTTKPAALQVTSTPQASLFLDGKHLGKTPFKSDQLKAGNYTLKLAVSEASYSEKITLTEGTLTVLNRELAANFQAQSGEILSLVPGRSGLFISSMPAGADVTIDGRLAGQTPLLTGDIEEGDHKIQLSRPGYLLREFAIKASSRYLLTADVTLAWEIAKNGQPLPSPPPTVKVEITKTPQGFLRVRKEPSTGSAEIGRVKPGDELEVIQETGDWIKVGFEAPPSGEAGKQGWISSQYAKKVQ